MPETTIPTHPASPGDPVPETLEAVGLAMARLEAARSSVRKALVGLSEVGLHQEAEHCTVIVDSIDDLRQTLIGEPS